MGLLGWCVGQRPARRLTQPVRSDFLGSQVDPVMAGHTSAHLQPSRWHSSSLEDCWGTHMDMFAFIHVQPTSVAILSLLTICIFRPSVTVSIQHLHTSIPTHPQHLFRVVYASWMAATLISPTVKIPILGNCLSSSKVFFNTQLQIHMVVFNNLAIGFHCAGPV